MSEKEQTAPFLPSSDSSNSSDLSYSSDSLDSINLSDSGELDPDMRKEFGSSTQKVQSGKHERQKSPLLRRIKLDPGNITDDDFKREGYTKGGRAFNLYVKDYPENPREANQRIVPSSNHAVKIEYDLYNCEGKLIKTTRRQKFCPLRKFFSSQPTRRSITFCLCTNKFGGALEEGIRGMRRGGMRRIIVTPEGMEQLGYPEPHGYGVYVVKLHRFWWSGFCRFFRNG